MKMPFNIATKGNEIYQDIKDDIETDFNGKYIVIEVVSGKYYIGNTGMEADTQARSEFPNIVLYGRRIGELDTMCW